MELKHTVEAYNTEPDSENKIHDDEVAQTFGFEGGLVPAVDVFGYMSQVPVAHWGRAWLERGEMEARFIKPVYDGRLAQITGRAPERTPERTNDDISELSLEIESMGEVCATGRAAMPKNAALSFNPDDFRIVPLPVTRPPASRETLMPGQTLGTVSICWEDRSSAQRLQAARETSPIFEEEGIAHSRFLVRAADSAMEQNFAPGRGPWIDVSLSLQNHSVARVNEKLEARSIVRENYENKGHLIAELDVLVLGPEERRIASIQHTIIYEPRQVREA